MNTYVETNFILELAFQQKESAICKEILDLCTSGKLQLIIPAYSLVEPYEKLKRQESSRKNLKQNMDEELNQLLRTSSYQKHEAAIQEIGALLIESSADEKRRFSGYRQVFLDHAEIIPMTQEIIIEAVRCESHLGLPPQDAVVYASALVYLQQQPNREKACFININTTDFGKPEVKAELAKHGCRLIYRFTEGLQFIRSQIE